MDRLPPLPPNTVKALSDILGDTNEGLTGSQIECLLEEAGICLPEDFAWSSKRDLLNKALIFTQEQSGGSTYIFRCLRIALDPLRDIRNKEKILEMAFQVNTVLSLCGFLITEGGKLKLIKKAETLAEAEIRQAGLLDKITQRSGIHDEVLKYCRAELLMDNYFHAVLEATKGVFERLRELSGHYDLDGADLIERCFSGKSPEFIINNYQNASEEAEQKGFANLLKGIYGMFRTPLGHSPKVVWKIEENDAIDLMTLLSMVHRRLDVMSKIK